MYTYVFIANGVNVCPSLDLSVDLTDKEIQTINLVFHGSFDNVKTFPSSIKIFFLSTMIEEQ